MRVETGSARGGEALSPDIPLHSCGGSIEALPCIACARPSVSFRCIRAAAPLKPPGSQGLNVLILAFRCIRAAAPLKQRPARACAHYATNIPLHSCGGSIEAPGARGALVLVVDHSAAFVRRLH